VRFRHLDAYRVQRELQRYEGTAQRDLYRELRERFLFRHQTATGWVLDLGSGPGRFLPFLGGDDARPVAVDLSMEMLRQIPDVWAARNPRGPVPDRVRADARRPPFAPRRGSRVVLLGNTLGFAERDAEEVLSTAEDLVAPGGVLVVEVAPASGERSRYLTRLPRSSVARLLRAPPAVVVPRIDREGFVTEPARRVKPGNFRRFGVPELHDRWRRRGWELLESVAVAPALGLDRPRLEQIRSDTKSWSHLLEVEETVGRRAERWGHAAAVLLSARRPPA